MLRKFDEPKLFNSTDTQTIYRFTWLRSFDFPMTVSLIVTGNQITLQTKIGNKINIDNSHFDLRKLSKKETERFYEYTNRKIDSLSVADLFQKGIYVKDTVKFRYITQTRELTADEYQKFKDLVHKKQFWTYSAMGKTIFGVDGADWILEGRDKEHEYHFVYRWSPSKDRDSEFKELLNYTNWDDKEKESVLKRLVTSLVFKIRFVPGNNDALRNSATDYSQTFVATRSRPSRH